MTIGVFDSGFGGLTVLRELVAHLPHADYLYLGDSARLPYGSKSPSTVAHYASASARFLVNQGANCWSSPAIPPPRSPSSRFAKPSPFPSSASSNRAPRPPPNSPNPAASASSAPPPPSPVTPIPPPSSTINSMSSKKPVLCLCPLIEEGWIEHPVTEQVARIYLGELLAACASKWAAGERPDAVVLGCTHYPLLKPLLGRLLPAHMRMVDSAQAVAHEVARALASEHPSFRGAKTSSTSSPPIPSKSSAPSAPASSAFPSAPSNSSTSPNNLPSNRSPHVNHDVTGTNSCLRNSPHGSPRFSLRLASPPGLPTSIAHGIQTAWRFRPQSPRAQLRHRRPSAAATSSSKPGATPTSRKPPASIDHLPRRRRQHVRFRRHLLRRPLGRDPRQGHRGTPRQGPDLHQGHLPHRQTVPTTVGSSRYHLIDACRRQPEPPGHRLHRPLPPPWLRRHHPRRRNPDTLDDAGPRRQGPLHRLLQLLRLAPHEIPRRLRTIRLVPLRRPSGLLLADRPRL